VQHLESFLLELGASSPHRPPAPPTHRRRVVSGRPPLLPPPLRCLIVIDLKVGKSPRRCRSDAPLPQTTPARTGTQPDENRRRPESSARRRTRRCRYASMGLRARSSPGVPSRPPDEKRPRRENRADAPTAGGAPVGHGCGTSDHERNLAQRASRGGCCTIERSSWTIDDLTTLPTSPGSAPRSRYRSPHEVLGSFIKTSSSRFAARASSLSQRSTPKVWRFRYRADGAR